MSMTHVRYYQKRTAKLKRIDDVVRVVAAVAASGTVGSLLKDLSFWGIKGHSVSVFLGLTSAILLAVSAALQIPDKIRGFAVLLAEYTGHKQVFNRLYLQAHQEPEQKFEPKLERAIDKYNQTEKREPKDDSVPDRKLLAECMEEVEASLGSVVPPAQGVAPSVST